MAGIGTGAPIVKVYHEKSMILPDVSRVLACLYEKDIKFERCTASYKSLLRLQASSHAPVPFYDGPKFLEESREICRYIAETYEHHGYQFLLGKDALERASIEQWLHHEEHAFNPPSRALFCHLAFPLDGEEDEDIEMQKTKLEEVLDVYDQRLSDSEFLAGNKFTLADLVHLPNSHHITASGKFVYLYDSRKNVQRWWNDISTRNSWKQVLRDMKEVEEQAEQHKLEEFEKQKQQQWQIEHQSTTDRGIQLDRLKRTSTKSHTILVPPPADTVSISPMAPQAEQPHPTDSSSDKAPVLSTQSTTHKSLPAQSKQTTFFSTHQETPPSSILSTQRTSTSFMPTPSTFPTTADKPSQTDADKPSIRDASIPSGTSETDLPTKPKLSSSKEVAHYIEPTPQNTPESLENLSENDGPSDAIHAKISPKAAKEESDRLNASDFYKNVNTSTSVHFREKKSISHIEDTSEAIHGKSTARRVTDSSPNTLHSTEAHHMLQAQQWHAATVGLHNLKGDIDVPSQEEKPSRDVQQHPSTFKEGYFDDQDSTKEYKHTDSRPKRMGTQDSFEEIKAGASALPREQPSDILEAATPPSRQAEAKDARSPTPSQEGYAGAQAASKQSRDPGSKPTRITDRDARVTFVESKATDSTSTREQSSDAWQAEGPILGDKEYEVRSSTTKPFQDNTRKPEDITAMPQQITSQDAKEAFEETKFSDSASPQVQPLYHQRSDSHLQKQEEIEEPRSTISPLKKSYANVEDTTKHHGGTYFKSREMLGEDAQESTEETKALDSAIFRGRAEPQYTQQAATTPSKQEAGKDTPSVTPLSPTGYPTAEETSRQPRRTASTLREKELQDARDAFDESKSVDSTSSREQPSDVQQATASLPKQEVADARRTTMPIRRRYPDTVGTTKEAEDISVTPQKMGDAAIEPRPMVGKDAQNTFEQTNIGDSTLLREQSAHTWEGTTTPVEQAATRDGLNVTPSKQEFRSDEDSNKQPSRTDSTPKRIAAQDANGTFEESKPTSSVSSRLQPLNAWRLAVPPPRQEIKDSPSTTSFQKRDPEDSTKKIGHSDSSPTHIAYEDAEHTFEGTMFDDSASSNKKPKDSQQVLPLSKQAEAQDTWDGTMQSRDSSDKGRESKETISAPKKMLAGDAQDTRGERKITDFTSREQYPSHLQASSQSRQAAPDDVPDATKGAKVSFIDETRQSPEVKDNTRESRVSSEETKDPVSISGRAQSFGSHDTQHANEVSRIPTADQRKDVSTEFQLDAQDVYKELTSPFTNQRGMGSPPQAEYGKDDQATTREKIFSTERLGEILKESEATAPETRPADSQGPVAVEETPSIYQKNLKVAQDSHEQAKTLPTGGGGKADDSTPKLQSAPGSPSTSREKSAASESPKAKFPVDHGTEYPMKKDTVNDREKVPPFSSQGLTSQAQQALEPSEEAAPNEDMYTKSSTIDKWRQASKTLPDVTHASGDDVPGLATIDQMPTPISQEAIPSSQVTNEITNRSIKQRAEPPAPVAPQTSSDVQHALPSFPGAASAERAGEHEQIQAPTMGSHATSTPIKGATTDPRETSDQEFVNISDVQSSDASKSNLDSAIIHEDTHGATLSNRGAIVDDKTTTRAFDKTEMKPASTNKEGMAPAAGQESTMESQLGGILASEVVRAEQKFALSDQESARATLPISSVEPSIEDTNVSAAEQTKDPETIFHQQAKPPAPIRKEVPASDNQYVISKIQDISPDNLPTQEQVSHASQRIPGREGIMPVQGKMDSPILDAQLASENVQKPGPNDQGSHVGHAFEPHEGPSHVAYGVVADKETTESLSRQAQSLEASPTSTQTHGYVHPTSGDKPAILLDQGAQSSAATQEPTHPGALDSASTQDFPADSLVSSKKLRPHSTDQEAISLVSNQTLDLSAQPDSALGEVEPAKQKLGLSDQDSAHSTQEIALAAVEQTKELPKSTSQQATLHMIKPPTAETQNALQIIPSQETPKVPSQEKVSRAEYAFEPPEGPTPHAHDNIVDEKKTRPLDSLTRSSDAVLDLTPASGNVQPTSGSEPPRTILPVQGTQTPSATQTPPPPPPPFVSRESMPSEDIPADTSNKVKSMRPLASPDAPHAISHGEVALSEQEIISADPGSANSAQKSLSSEPKEEESTIAAPDQTNALQAVVGEQDISPPEDHSIDGSSSTQEGVPNVEHTFEPHEGPFFYSHGSTVEGPMTHIKGPTSALDAKYDQDSDRYSELPSSTKSRKEDMDIATADETKAKQMSFGHQIRQPVSAPSEASREVHEAGEEIGHSHDQEKQPVAAYQSSLPPKNLPDSMFAQKSTADAFDKDEPLKPANKAELAEHKITPEPSFSVGPRKEEPISDEGEQIKPSQKIMGHQDIKHVPGISGFTPDDLKLVSKEQVSNAQYGSEPHKGPPSTSNMHNASMNKNTTIPPSQAPKSDEPHAPPPTPIDVEPGSGHQSTTRSVPDQGAEQPQLPAMPESPPSLETLNYSELHHNVPDETLDKNKFSETLSVDQEVMLPTVIPTSAVDPQHVTVPDEVIPDEQKNALPDLTRSAQPSSTAEPIKEESVVASSDQTNASQTIIGQEVPSQEHSSYSEGSTTDSRDTTTDEKITSTSGQEKGSDAVGLTANHHDFHPSSSSEPAIRNLPKHGLQPPESTTNASIGASTKAKSTNQEDIKPMVGLASAPDTVHDQDSTHSSQTPSTVETRENERSNFVVDKPIVSQTNSGDQITPVPDVSVPSQEALEAPHVDPHAGELAKPLMMSQDQVFHAGSSSEQHHEPTADVHGATVEEKMQLPSSQAQASDTGPDSTQLNGDTLPTGGHLTTSSPKNQEAQRPIVSQAPPAEDLDVSASVQSVSADLEAPRVPSTDEAIMKPTASLAPTTDAPQDNDSTHSMQLPPSIESSNSRENAKASSGKEANVVISDILPTPAYMQPSLPKESMEVTEEDRNQQNPYQNVVQSPQDKKGHVEETEVQETRTVVPKETDLHKNINPMNNGASQEKALDQSGKQASGVQQASSNKNDVSKSTEDTSSGFQTYDKSENNLGTSEEYTRKLKTKGNTQGEEIKVPAMEMEQHKERDVSDVDLRASELLKPLMVSEDQISNAGGSDEQHSGPTAGVHGATVEEKMQLPSSEAQTSDTGPNSTQLNDDTHPTGGHLITTSSVGSQAPPVGNFNVSASVQNVSANLEAPRAPSTDEAIMESTANLAPNLEAPQDMDPVQPPHETSLHLSSDEKTTMFQNGQANNLANVSFSASQAVPDQSGEQPKGNTQGEETETPASEMVQPKERDLQANRTQSINQMNNEASQVEVPDQSGKQPKGNTQGEETETPASGMEQPQERDLQANSTQGINEMNNETSQVEVLDQLGKQPKGTSQAEETETPASEMEQPRERDLQANSTQSVNQMNNEISQVEVPNQSGKQPKGNTQGEETETPASEMEQAKERDLQANSTQSINQMNNEASQVEVPDQSGEQSKGNTLGEETETSALEMEQPKERDLQANSNQSINQMNNETSQVEVPDQSGKQPKGNTQGEETETPASEMEQPKERDFQDNSTPNINQMNNETSQVEVPDQSAKQSKGNTQGEETQTPALKMEQAKERDLQANSTQSMNQMNNEASQVEVLDQSGEQPKGNTQGEETETLASEMEQPKERDLKAGRTQSINQMNNEASQVEVPDQSGKQPRGNSQVEGTEIRASEMKQPKERDLQANSTQNINKINNGTSQVEVPDQSGKQPRGNTQVEETEIPAWEMEQPKERDLQANITHNISKINNGTSQVEVPDQSGKQPKGNTQGEETETLASEMEQAKERDRQDNSTQSINQMNNETSQVKAPEQSGEQPKGNSQGEEIETPASEMEQPKEGDLQANSTQRINQMNNDASQVEVPDQSGKQPKGNTKGEETETLASEMEQAKERDLQATSTQSINQMNNETSQVEVPNQSGEQPKGNTQGEETETPASEMEQPKEGDIPANSTQSINQMNNVASQVEVPDQSGKQPNGNTQGKETETPASEMEQPKERDLQAISTQSISSQLPAQASNITKGQTSSSTTKNMDENSRKLDGSTNDAKPGDAEDSPSP